jgi:hypothetical protein
MRDATLNPKPKYFQTTVDTVLDTEDCASLRSMISCRAAAVCN